jgi:hypothetical protein
VSADRVVLDAFPDAGQVADEADGTADVLIVAADVAVPFQPSSTSAMRSKVIW